MTAQAHEILFLNGYKTSMASEPLNQYLQNRNDITFGPQSSSCWRGYYGQWKIEENKLFLIGLEAYIIGDTETEVGLNYLFPGQKEVFANWFNGEIRIPQGKMLEYVHRGYASLYERDLFLVFENGILINQYEVNNNEEYQNRLIKRLSLTKESNNKKKKRNIVISILAIILIGICMGIYYLIMWGSVISYVISTILGIGLIFLIFLVIKITLKK